MSEKQFDASRYLVRLKGKDYLEVKWRLLWLRTEHPDALVETEMVSHTFQPPMAVFRARVTIPEGGSATGWGHEDAADFGDYLEKAETKALGRALAALGYGTQFTEEFDFVAEDGQRVVDAPVDRAAVGQGRAAANGQQNGASRPALASVASGSNSSGRSEARPVLPASEAQVKAIYAIGRGAQSMDEAEIDARCREAYGVVPAELSRRQASEFIDALKGGQLRNFA